MYDNRKIGTLVETEDKDWIALYKEGLITKEKLEQKIGRKIS